MTGPVMQPKRAVGRREAVALGVSLCCGGGAARGQASSGPRSQRPAVGDQLVRATGEGEPLRPEDVAPGAKQMMAWAKDPTTGTVRDGSRLNQVLLLRLDPASLDDETRPHAADGVLAFSATCTHAQCPVSEWREEAGVLHCPCHGSEFDPRAGGRVVNGPATRHLPMLPLRLSSAGGLEVARSFIGKVGGQVA